MTLLYLLVSFSLFPFSYANYGPPGDISTVTFVYETSVFRIGRDIYTYGNSGGEISKFGIAENKSFYDESYKVKDLDFTCFSCFSFVLSNDSVLIFTGFDNTVDINKTNGDNMGVFYFNPIENTASKGNSYKMLQGNPLQRVYQQAVMTPDKKSVYIFGGVEHTSPINLNPAIVQFDIATSTFISHDTFTFIGGTATMLPSGIAVLAFGASNVNQTGGKALYDTSYVHLYDTNKNTLYTQNISGNPPLGRASASGTLGNNKQIIIEPGLAFTYSKNKGPDNECIYYYGGGNFDILVDYRLYTPSINRNRVQIRSDLIVLNTTSWEWQTPSVSGPPSNGRYEHFASLYEDNSLIVGGGYGAGGKSLYDISVLRNLPTSDDHAGLGNLQWFTNTDLDTIYDDDGKGGLSSGAIAGIVIGVSIPVFVIFYFLSKKFEGFRGVFWKRRLGEPVWTEIVRILVRFVLLGILLAYIIYSIIRAVNSPSVYQEETTETKKIPLPDIRICGISNELLTRFEYTVSCSFTDSQDCSHYFYPYINDSYDPYLVLNGGQTRCQIFIPPRDIYFQSNAATYPSELKDKMVFRVFKNNASVSVSSFYITYFASQNSPYRTFFGMSGDDSEMSQQDAIDWIGAAAETMNLQNTYSFDNSVHVNSRYSLNETRYLTGSSWNYFGFANIYNTTHGITPSFNPITVPLNGGVNSSSSWDLTFSLTVEPSDYTIRSIKEQKVSTILGGLASAGGVFSAFMALQTLLFGFRPDSPWEIVHRWSWGRQSESLRDQLNVGNSPVPMATRVRGEYHLLPESSDSTTLEMVPLNENDGDQSDGSKLRKMEDRMQLMEDLFKTYYIDDEVFQKLNEARKNNTSKSNEKSEKVEGESSFTSINQENEEAPMSQIDHKRDSKVLP